MLKRFQSQLDVRAIEVAAATAERFDRHEKTCGERWAENRDAMNSLKAGMEARAALTMQLHEYNKKTLGQIKLTLAALGGGGAVIAFLASDAGRNVMLILTNVTNHH